MGGSRKHNGMCQCVLLCLKNHLFTFRRNKVYLYGECSAFAFFLFFKSVFLVFMNTEELYTHVSVCKALYVQDILCSTIYSMLLTTGCYLADGRFSEYTKTIKSTLISG